MFAIEVLMQSVVIAGFVLQQDGSRPGLTGPATLLNEVRMLFRVLHRYSHCAVPSIGDRHQPWIHSSPEVLNQSRKRIIEILVFTAPKPMPSHRHLTAENNVHAVEASYGPAFGLEKEMADDRTAFRVEILFHTFPIDGSDAIGDACHGSYGTSESVHLWTPLMDMQTRLCF